MYYFVVCTAIDVVCKSVVGIVLTIISLGINTGFVFCARIASGLIVVAAVLSTLG